MTKGILLAGLTDHEAAAIEIMVGMTWHDYHCTTLKRSLSLSVPAQGPVAQACDGCVVDLFGLGLRRRSTEGEARLLQFLAGRPGVLLVWGNGGGWLDEPVPLAPGQIVEWVTMPYTSAVLRDAIGRVRAGTAAAVAAPAVPVPVQVPVAQEAEQPAWRRAMALAEQMDRRPRVPLDPPPQRQAAGDARPRPSAATPAPAAISMPAPTYQQPHTVGLRRGALAALLQAFPMLAGVPMLQLAAKIVRGSDTQLLRIGGDTAFVVSVTDGWLACGLPIPTLIRLMRTPHLVEGVEVLDLPLDKVEATVRQRFDGRFHRTQRPLDVIVWELLQEAVRDVSLQLAGSLTLQLRRFPNFTLLREQDPLHLQLAAICARAPQSVTELMRAFPHHAHSVAQFAVLSVASGLAAVVPPSTDIVAPSSVVPSRDAAAGRRGFFKSLLDKLF